MINENKNNDFITKKKILICETKYSQKDLVFFIISDMLQKTFS